MDVEKLIKEVFVAESLWNQAHPDHHNRFILEKQWNVIGDNMNATKDAVKNKWKYLRDTFRKELTKCKKGRSGKTGGFIRESKWAYFKYLLFLKDQFAPRKSNSNSLDMPLELHMSQEEIEDNADIESNFSGHTDHPFSFEADSDSTFDLPCTSTPTSNDVSQELRVIRRKRKRSPGPEQEALLNVDEENLTLLETKSHKSLRLDEDRCFFESLLPHVQKMDPIKKLQFRNKIQEVVMLYAYNYSESPSSKHTTNVTRDDHK